MHEMITKSEVADLLPPDGEGATSWMGGRPEIEHLHWYRFARVFCRNKHVLDVSCGEGYGTAFLWQVAKSVVGVDISAVSAADSLQSHQAASLRFTAGNARRLPMPDASVDVVVSFSAIWDLPGYQTFLSEVRRVIRPDGLLIVSAPDKVDAPVDTISSRFRARELDETGFGGLLRAAFREVESPTERQLANVMMLSADASAAQAIGHAQTQARYEYSGTDIREHPSGRSSRIWLASDRPIILPRVDMSGDSPPHGPMPDRPAVDQWQIEEAEKAKALLKDRLAQVELQRADVQQRLDLVQRRLDLMLVSSSWRLTAPLRSAAAAMPPSLRRRARQAAKLAYWMITPRKTLERLAFIAARTTGRPAPGTALHLDSDPAPPGAAPLGGDPPSSRNAEGARRRLLGTLAPPRPQSVRIGIVTYNNSELELRRLVRSAQIALGVAGAMPGSGILVLDNGQSTEATLGDSPDVRYLPSAGNVGFGAGHNRLMEAAFASGAEVYIAANPDGAFHPEAVAALLQMLQAHRGQALIEAVQFPVEHPKVYDPNTFETPWASGACFATPKVVFDETGGFDEAFFLYCEDVDFSWRVRAAGFPVKICPRALFMHPVTNRKISDETQVQYLKSGILLARKWKAPRFANDLAEKLKKHRVPMPDAPQTGGDIPEHWLDIADFDHVFSFAPARW